VVVVLQPKRKREMKARAATMGKAVLIFFAAAFISLFLHVWAKERLVFISWVFPTG
jgi:hypothetical protein